MLTLKTADPSQVPMLDIHSLSLILSKLWYVQLVLAAQALAVMVGLIQVGLGVLKLGILANFLSYPVLTGFINGAAITIIISQVQVCVSLLLSRTDNHESFTWVSRLAVDSIFSEFLESQSIQELRQVS
jgi:sulfate permease, SulP family